MATLWQLISCISEAACPAGNVDMLEGEAGIQRRDVQAQSTHHVAVYMPEPQAWRRRDVHIYCCDRSGHHVCPNHLYFSSIWRILARRKARTAAMKTGQMQCSVTARGCINSYYPPQQPVAAVAASFVLERICTRSSLLQAGEDPSAASGPTRPEHPIRTWRKPWFRSV